MRSITRSTSSVPSFDLPWNEHPYNLQRALERFERDYVRNILVLTAWDLASTATMLGISQKMLETKVRQYELAPSNSTLERCTA